MKKDKDIKRTDACHLVLFFTWGVSLKTWQEKGLLQRETRLYETLAAKGVKVTFLTWGDEADNAIAEDWSDIDVIPLFMRLPQPKNKFLRGLCSLFAPWIVRKTLRTADILKTNQMAGGWVAVLSKVFYRKPLIVRCGYELYHFTCCGGAHFLRRRLVWLGSYLTYRSADNICLATQEDAAFVVKTFGVSADKISIHPNWIDTEVFRPLDGSQKPEHILFVGRLNYQKNLKSLVSAIAGTEWGLDIVGEGALQKDLEEQAHVEGGDVRFLGVVPNDELPAFYNRYPVYVLPSFYEGNPKTLLEAMACGVAVLGTNVDGIRSVIKDGETGLLCDISPDSLRGNLEKLFNDDALRSRLGEAARKQILKTNSLSALVAQDLALYDLLCRRSTARKQGS